MTKSSSHFWETVYSRNISKMIGICYRYTADRQLSEDLAHDAFLKAIDRASSFEGKGHFDAWLRRIVVNHVLQHFRDQKKNKNFDDWLQYESSIAQIEDNQLNTCPPEHTEFSEKELFEAINSLPNHHRLVFNLYVIDNFTHAEIGDKLGISPGTSKSHLARARKKIRQLLTEKTNNKPMRKRGFLFFLFPFNLGNVDKLYGKVFSNFSLSPEKALSIKFSASAAMPVLRTAAFVSWNIIAAASAGIILTAGTVVYLIQEKNSGNGRVAFPQVTVQQKDSLDLIEKPLKKSEKTNSENNPAMTTPTATISSNSVIIKNLKNTTMKSLDSLGLLFLMSSGITFDSAAQSNFKKDLPFNNEAQVFTLANQAMQSPDLPASATALDFKKRPSEKGTFSASSLLWAAENKELYFKGEVRINIGSNKFNGDGTFTFLGPVGLVIVDGQQIAPGASVKLSKQQYRLNSLSNREATNKYGEKGRNGAVEISVIQ